jgi:SAM-dependent methyltransferase
MLQHSRRNPTNRHQQTIEGFGDEWSWFDQSSRPEEELRRTFSQYFAVFPWEALPKNARGIDVGCGSGRWARFVAERVGSLCCIDPSEQAIRVAARNLEDRTNCFLVVTAAGELPFSEGSMDFGYSLGVLHHTPDPLASLTDAVRKLKPGSPFLVYLYYALDNRPNWYRMLWRATDICRRVISRLPRRLRFLVSQAIAALIYFPLARFARLVESAGFSTAGLPLAAYRDKSFYAMRTDALDRFGTGMEERFTAGQVEELMRAAGLTDIAFAPTEPFWCALGYREPPEVLPA